MTTQNDSGLPLALTKRALAAQMGVSTKTIDRLRARGVLPPVVPGLSRPRWSRDAIVRWLRDTGR